MGHKGDRKKIVRYWQQLSEVERSMREHESVQEERESNAKGGRVECWKCVPIVQKTAQLCICQKTRRSIAVYSLKHRQRDEIYLKLLAVDDSIKKLS